LVLTLWVAATLTGECGDEKNGAILIGSSSSGFEGPWTFSPTSFTNEFYKLLLSEKWQWRKWNGPKQLEDKQTKSLMMLP
jgi:catalase (peroxidase I)